MQKVKQQQNDASKTTTLKKFVGIIVNIGFILALALAVLVVFFMVQEKFTGGTSRIGGFRMYIVLSGSMEPLLHTGSMVFVNPVAAETVLENDIITFISPDDRDKLITHRVVSINRDEQMSFVTRGDANDVNDSMSVPAADIIGKVSFDIPYIGYLMSFARTKAGLLFLIIIPALFIIILEMRKLFQYAVLLDREKEAKKQAVIKLDEHIKEWSLNEPVETDVASTDQK